jgi:hypothetical protein
MTMRGQLEESWATLTAASPTKRQIRAEPTGVRTASGEVLAGLDGDGNRLLLIPVQDMEDVVEDRRSAGVQIRRAELEDRGDLQPFAAVTCLMPALDDIFTVVASEIVDAIGRAPGSAVAVSIETLNRWRELLESPTSRLLGPDQLAGLFAELVVLSHLARRTRSALELWTGPEHDQHDFVSGQVHLEVKATTVREGRSAEIHGVEQLDARTPAMLWLAFFRLDSGEAGQSVPDLIEKIIGLGVDRRALADALARAGYDVRHSVEYRLPRLEIRERRVYPVDDTFPRIIPSSFSDGSMPAGVMRLRYYIDLTNEPPTPMPEQEVEDLLDRLARAS